MTRSDHLVHSAAWVFLIIYGAWTILTIVAAVVVWLEESDESRP